MSEHSIRTIIVVKRELGRAISGRLGEPGSVLELRVDNRYKDNNIKAIGNILRGNKCTLALVTKGVKNG